MRFLRRSILLMISALSIALIVGLCITSALALTGTFDGQTWPGNTLRIYNQSARKQAVEDSVRGLNQVGMKLHLILVKDPSQAQVVISDERELPSGCANAGTVGCAPLGYRPEGSWVKMIQQDYGMVDEAERRQIIMHELGHVLGLRHRQEGCGLMSPRVCDPTQRFQIDLGCPLQNRFGLSRRDWCSGVETTSFMCRPTLEAAQQLVALYGGHIPHGYTPWCKQTHIQEWYLDCAYPGWHSPHNPYPSDIDSHTGRCYNQQTLAGWQGLATAQEAARRAYINALHRQDEIVLQSAILGEIRRLDRMAKLCPGGYCYPAIGLGKAGDEALAYRIYHQIQHGRG